MGSREAAGRHNGGAQGPAAFDGAQAKKAGHYICPRRLVSRRLKPALYVYPFFVPFVPFVPFVVQIADSA